MLPPKLCLNSRWGYPSQIVAGCGNFNNFIQLALLLLEVKILIAEPACEVNVNWSCPVAPPKCVALNLPVLVGSTCRTGGRVWYWMCPHLAVSLQLHNSSAGSREAAILGYRVPLPAMRPRFEYPAEVCPLSAAMRESILKAPTKVESPPGSKVRFYTEQNLLLPQS